MERNYNPGGYRLSDYWQTFRGNFARARANKIRPCVHEIASLAIFNGGIAYTRIPCFTTD